MFICKHAYNNKTGGVSCDVTSHSCLFAKYCREKHEWENSRNVTQCDQFLEHNNVEGQK